MTRAEAYRRTLYQAGDVRVRIGRKSPSADRWMALHGAQAAGFITAWNPMSRPMPARWNAAAQARLGRDLKGHAVTEGEGRLGRWCENMFLATAGLRKLRRLAGRYRQAAFVWVRRGRRAALIYSWSRASK